MTPDESADAPRETGGRDGVESVADFPFTAGSRRLLIHCCYHKVGTRWMRGILEEIGQRFGLRFYKVIGPSNQALPPNTDILFDRQSRTDLAVLSDFRASHMIRDPRDVVVSGYHYHLWTKEEWVHQPKEAYGGFSYQAYLNSLDPEDGLIAEIERCAGLFRRMAAWNYHDPRFFEIRYESLVHDDGIFRALFRHYGFDSDAIAIAIAIAKAHGFESKTSRKLGDVVEGTALRSGVPGQWREYFTERIKDRFKSVAQQPLVDLGYETGSDW